MIKPVNHRVRLAARPFGLPEFACSDGTGVTRLDPLLASLPTYLGALGTTSAALREHAPGGVGVFFDNVGGDILDAVLTHLARGARIVLSGGVSQYNAQQARGPANYLDLISARGSLTGFLTPDYAGRYAEARAEMAGWLRDGQLISPEDIREGGVRAFPDALPRLFAGENSGKLILAVP